MKWRKPLEREKRGGKDTSREDHMNPTLLLVPLEGEEEGK